VSFASLKLRFLVLGVLATTSALAVTGPASAATLAGPWASFTNCPVNEPAFIEYPQTGYAATCVAASSPSGSLTIGNTTVQTGSTDIEFGAPGSEPEKPFVGFIVPATENQTLVSAPAQVPGGLVGLMCPSKVLLVSALCNTATKNGLNEVTAAAELAGTPTNFSRFAANSTGTAILTLPVKIHLQNPLLGSSCYIGSDQEPIVLHPAGTAIGTKSETLEQDPNRYPITFITIADSTQGDSTFAVPGTSGCGGALSTVLDEAVNLKEGLPSPAGKNDLVLDDSTSSIAFTPEKTVLREAWNASCLTGGCDDAP
jgi:hypothetical protein